MVSTVVDPNPVEHPWVEMCLGLKPIGLQPSLNFMSVVEASQKKLEIIRNRDSISNSVQSESSLGNEGVSGQFGSHEKLSEKKKSHHNRKYDVEEGERKEVNFRHLMQSGYNNKLCDKGKNEWIRKPKVKLQPIHDNKAKIILEKKLKECHMRGSDGDDSSSSSGHMMGFRLFKGESSNRNSGKLINGLGFNEPNGPNKEFDRLMLDSNCSEEEAEPTLVSNSVIKDGSLPDVGQSIHIQLGLYKETDKELESFQRVEAVPESPIILKKIYGRKKLGCSLKKHDMRTRNSKNPSNEDVEIPQKKTKAERNMTRHLDEEIEKVIKTGVALGFDFNGKEKKVGEEVARREFKDTVREERIGVVHNATSRRNFNDFIRRANVVNIPLHGLSFAWTNFRERAAWARLDRFLISPEILIWYPNITQKGLARSLSDHNAIGLGQVGVDWGLTPFRFYNSWLEEKHLMNEVSNEWSRSQSREPVDQKASWIRPTITNLGLKRLSEYDKEWLEGSFSCEEAWEALCSCDGNKAPGPDGMNLNFIKANWVVRVGNKAGGYIFVGTRQWAAIRDRVLLTAIMWACCGRLVLHFGRSSTALVGSGWGYQPVCVK
ncbi:hypothetical protein Ddye_031171 [Dipteronia dyeriana]|uniref:Uncharacterized protein n=1 Tax=Dipteronia dyeriana TaxID=168575 RepID=A0AAD9TIR7_9ROSI|nr:hypothetical protein Ddye_031171 [Dipteronia dyeriana]